MADTLLLMSVFLGEQTGKVFSWASKRGNICFGNKMFLKEIGMSATNVARVGKQGNICVRNNMSATMCPHLQTP